MKKMGERDRMELLIKKELEEIYLELNQLTLEYDGLDILISLSYINYEEEKSYISYHLLEFISNLAIVNYNKSMKKKVTYEVLEDLIGKLDKYIKLWANKNYIEGINDTKLNEINREIFQANRINNFGAINPYYVYRYNNDKFIRFTDGIKDELQKILGFDLSKFNSYNYVLSSYILSAIEDIKDKIIANYIKKKINYKLIKEKRLEEIEHLKKYANEIQSEVDMHIRELFIDSDIDLKKNIIISKERLQKSYIIEMLTMYNKVFKGEEYKAIEGNKLFKEEFGEDTKWETVEQLCLLGKEFKFEEFYKELEKFLVMFSTDIDNISTEKAKDLLDIDILKQKPIIKKNDEFLIINPVAFEFHFQQIVENEINMVKGIREKYIELKSDFVEKEALDLIKKVLPNALTYRKLYYSDDISDSIELDGLIKYDRTIILLEAKSRKYSIEAKKGKVSKLGTAFKRNIGEAINQLNRLRTNILKNKITNFYDKNGKKLLQINSEDVQNIFFMNVTYENFYDIASVMTDLRDVNIINTDNKIPWSVCIDDLKVISDFIESPHEFIYYIYIREAMNNNFNNIRTYKNTYELDFLGAFIHRNHDIEEIEEYYIQELDEVKLLKQDIDQESIILDYSPIFNKYYLNETKELRGDIPRVKYNDRFKKMINELPSLSGEGYTVVALTLLILDLDRQEKLMSIIDKLIEKTNKDKQVHSGHMMNVKNDYEDELFGISVVSCYNNQKQYASNFLQWICVMNKYEYKRSKWLGILITVDKDEKITGYAYITGKYKYSSILEKKIKLYKEQVLTKKINELKSHSKMKRNEKCYCGSGKKYKLCHGNN